MLDLYILMEELIFKYMPHEEYFAPDKDVGDYSNFGYSQCMAGSASSETMQKATNTN